LKSFSRVASELYITQSAVSRQVKNLEKKLGVKLFTRLKEGVVPTEEGKTFLGYAEQILALYDKTAREMERLKHTCSGRIIVGASTTLGEYILPKAISTFTKHCTEAEIYLRVSNTEEILRQLHHNAFSVALVEEQIENFSFVNERLFEDELVLITSSRHPWTRRQNGIKLGALLTEPLVIREKGSGTRKILERSLRNFGIALSDLKIQMELDSTEAIKNSVREGLGVSFVPRFTLTNNLQGLRIVSIDRIKISFDYNVVYRQESGVSSLCLKFLEYLREEFSSKG
jgi:DNA-binding transcriptional LysR family regulator